MALAFNEYVLIILLVLAVYFDLTQKRIPNFITLPAIGWGLISYIVASGFNGFLFSIYGFLLGLGIFLIPYVAGGMGGGDVKLMAAIGALMGTEFILLTAFFTAFCGGIMAVGYLIYKKRLLYFLKRALGILAVPFFKMLAFRLRATFFITIADFFSPEKLEKEKQAFLPYGVAIALGALIVLSRVTENIFPLAELLGIK